ncbi:MAG TPA: tRNA (adenosine(37)-N6)-dimethylallyltransferase MiaA [Ktedonobacterales bacterium]|jgi:tRNA dimethylallyltransferase
MICPPPPIPLLALVGPTASGKTGLALRLALRLHGEIVSADSRQLYQGMDIGTAKPTSEERALVPHHLLDSITPDTPYTLTQYQADAQAAIAAIHAREHLPLLVGGTGLYIRAVVDNLAIPEVPPQWELRRELEAQAAREGAAALHARLAALDPASAARIDPANTRRVIRALEVCMVTGKPFSALQGARPSPYRALLLGLTCERARLYARVDRRVDAMIAAGFVDEVRALVARGYDWRLPAMTSLGYGEMGVYLRGETSLEEAVERLKYHTHSYIRRQYSWFRADARIHWLDSEAPDLEDAALALIQAWQAGG